MSPSRTSSSPPYTAAELARQIVELLAPAVALQREHQARLAPYRNTAGEVLDAFRAEYDDTRLETALEASDVLDTLVERLHSMLTAATDPTVPRAFTLALNGPGHDDGEAPHLFVVDATGLDDAHQRLTALPGYHAWVHAHSPLTTQDLDVARAASGPGVPHTRPYDDLRHQQYPPPSAHREHRPPAPSPLPAPPATPPTGRTATR